MKLPFENELFEILICPDSKSDLKFYQMQLVSCDKNCRRSYPVDDGIPVMLIDRSTVLSQDEWQQAMDNGISPASAEKDGSDA